MFDPDKTKEWARMWPLPLVAMLGIAGSGLFTFSSGVFMNEVVREFGWTKTQFTSAMMAPVALCLLLLPFIGRFIDRIGPRRVAIAGIIPTVLGTSMLGLANGSAWQWWLLCLVQAAGTVIIVPPVWLTAVVTRFDASRGLAIAVALAGVGFGTAVWPILAAIYVEAFGWRLAYPALAFTWGLVMLPLTVLFFYGARDKAHAADRQLPPPPPYGHVLRSWTFLCLAISGGILVCVSYGLVLHLVPILRADGLSLTAAAGLAGLAGLFSIIGRLVTGFLLDIMPSRVFGTVVFLLPIVVAALLLAAGGSFVWMLAAVVLLGLAMGAESDILTYIASRRFDQGVFGSIYSIIQTVFAVTSVAGSIVAGYLFDLSGSYDMFLYALMPATFIAAMLIGSIPEAGHRDVRGLAVDDRPDPALPAGVSPPETPAGSF